MHAQRGLGAVLWAVLALAPAPARSTSLCGDGFVLPPEECDDANTVTGDGCSFPSCLPEVCGDGIVNPDSPAAEICDDANTVDADVCPSDCSWGETMPRLQQACVDAVNKSLAGVIRAQTLDTAACIKAVAGAKTPLVTDCYGTDRKARVARAQARTDTTVTAKCTGDQGGVSKVPDFAFTSAATVNDAGEGAILGGSSDLFGSPPANVVLKASDKAAAACQAEIIKQHNLVVNKWIAEANKAKKNALEGEPNGPLSGSSAYRLAEGIGTALEDSDALAEAVAKVATAIDKKCPSTVAVDPLVECNGAATAGEVADCAVGTAFEAACTAFEEADFLDLPCVSFP